MRNIKYLPRLVSATLPGLLQAGEVGKLIPRRCQPGALGLAQTCKKGTASFAANTYRPAPTQTHLSLANEISPASAQPAIVTHPPAPSPKAQRLAALRLTLARLETTDPASCGTVLSLGDLDPHLPVRGLACGVLHEVTAAYADRPAAFGFTFALAAIAQQARPGPALFVAPSRATQDFGQPYAHGLEQLGLDAGRLILVETANDKDALWAIEEALRTQGLSVVVGAITGNLDLTAARRLNLVAAASATPLALLRIGKEATGPAATRWCVASAPAALDRHGAFSRWRWSVALERCRNGRPAHWLIEWNHVAHRFRMVEGLADRAPAAQQGPQAAKLRRFG